MNTNNQFLTQRDKAFSQGMMTFDDKSACLIHDSTYPPALHEQEYGKKYSQGVNMDRGGFGKRDDGSCFACLFDGTGGGGLESLHAAQDFTEQMLKELQKGPLSYSSDIEKEQRQVTALLTRCSFAKPTTLHGDATCVFVDITAQHLSAGALGDSGIIHIRQKEHQAHLFDTILKDDRTNITDTGGCIGRYGMLYRPDNVSAISHDIAKDDIIVLASDGLLDNLFRNEEDALLTIVVQSPFFDLELEEMKAHFQDKFAHQLPNAEELKNILLPFQKKNGFVTPFQVATRLNHYIKLITAKKFDTFTTLLEEWELVDSHSAKQAIGRKFKEAEQTLAGKCDDCLIIAIWAQT